MRSDKRPKDKPLAKKLLRASDLLIRAANDYNLHDFTNSSAICDGIALASKALKTMIDDTGD